VKVFFAKMLEEEGRPDITKGFFLAGAPSGLCPKEHILTSDS
jgi:hypothetical protein